MRSALALVLVVTPLLGACRSHAASPGVAASAPAPDGSVARMVAPAPAAHLRADGREGDLQLRGATGATLTFAAAPDPPGHRPLRGALLDAHVDGGRGDPLFFARAAWFGADGSVHPLVSADVRGVRCDAGSGGVRVTGTVDGVTLEQRYCARADGAFDVETRAGSPLPAGAALGAQLDAGAAAALVDHRGMSWTDRAPSRSLVLSEHGHALVFEGPAMEVVRGDGPGPHDDLSALLLQLRFGGTQNVLRLRVVAGDALDGLAALATATRAITLRGGPAEVSLVDAADEVVAHGRLHDATPRVVRLPPDLATHLRFRDGDGTVSAPLVLAPDMTVPISRTTVVHLAYGRADPAVAGQTPPLGVHVLFRALDAGRADPTPRVRSGGFSFGRSVYLPDGVGDVALAPGRYRLTANHGPQYSLAVDEVVVGAEAVSVRNALRVVVPTPCMVSADFHVHSARSPDSHVPLDERVGALECAGVDLAVATDHNHVTDYAPFVHAGMGTIQGEEVTTFEPTWGHFIVFPMPTPGGRGAGIVPFFQTTPARVFAEARARGAQIVQVNHPRLDPAMGYFNFTRFDGRTGRADPSFAADFDSIEVFNGLQIEGPTAVRAVLRDYVGLLRRGIHAAVTGNSDSHKLLFEEAGWPRTMVYVPREPFGTLPQRVIDALHRGHTSVNGGPLVELTGPGGALPGDTVRPQGGIVTVHLRVRAPSWVDVRRVELWLDDTVHSGFDITGPAVDGVRFDQDVTVPITRDVALIAWANGHTPLPDVLPLEHAIPMGFTSPLYVDADGDGRITLPPGPPR